MFIETRYYDRLHEFREKDLERAWRRRELVRLARENKATLSARALMALRSTRRRSSAAARSAIEEPVPPERVIPWSA